MCQTIRILALEETYVFCDVRQKRGMFLQTRGCPRQKGSKGQNSGGRYK